MQYESHLDRKPTWQTKRAATIGKYTTTNINYQKIYWDLWESAAYTASVKAKTQLSCQFNLVNATAAVICDCIQGNTTHLPI